MSILLTEILKNNNLHFIDDTKGGESISINDVKFIDFPDAKRNIVFLYLDNSFESIRVFFSFLKSQHTITLLSPTLKDHFKVELEELYKPLYISDFTRTEINAYSKIEDSVFKRIIINEVEIHQSVKLLLSTSGTTGSPKFVKLSEHNLLSNAKSISQYLPISAVDTTPLNLPIYYSYGLSVLTSNSIRGGRIVCSNLDVMSKDFWDRFEKYGYTSIAGVPFVYEMLDRIGFTKKTYPTLRYFTQAGGKLQDNLVKKFAEYANSHQVGFYVMYGQTEATARMSYLPPSKLDSKIGSIGIAIPDGSFFIAESNSELCYMGPNVFGGYVNAPEDLEFYEQLDVLKTGDVAMMDEDGYYFITGRLKRFVKIFGNRINLDEVEAIISKRNGDLVKCTGYKDKFILLFNIDPDFDFKDSINFLVSELKLHPSVLKSIILSEYPLTANGKIDYNQVTHLYESK